MSLTGQNTTRQLIDKVGFAHTLSQLETVLELIEKNLKNNSSVLDIGSGSGYLTICMI